MRLTIKLTAYAVVLAIATVVVFAGPCEDGCNFNNTNCTGAANTAYSQCTSGTQAASASCFQQADQEWTTCYQQADSTWATCIQNSHQQGQGLCTVMLQFDQYICDGSRDQAYSYCWNTEGVSQQVCEQNFVLDQQACANDYDNCLFICSTQNP